jgi:alpha-L-fucosidase
MTRAGRAPGGGRAAVVMAAALLAGSGALGEPPAEPFTESPARRAQRMAWWREARFGMFIHWGLYALPAGRWQGRPVGSAGEWIQHTAGIPVREYETLAAEFNPVRFDADEWTRIAAEAGMRYIVITSKHHDGFALFDSDVSGYDVMATPFGRDVMRELADACRRRGLRIGWYHSILDWHHPDYLPRKDWQGLPAEGADFDRYRVYLHAQVTELLTNYGPIDVMWFDGEWEPAWTHEHGLELEALVRRLQPSTIVNNRVDKGREGMGGLTRPGGFAGDFSTPEQEVPATGLPGVDWETCMTMNDTWGFKADDRNWKSAAELLRTLADVASKGGNFLLNVGPTALGEIPPQSVERLAAMGRWLAVNGDAIYGTSASPFTHLPWGRCTRRDLPGGGARLYLHVFDWPADRSLSVPGIANRPRGAFLLADEGRAPLAVARHEDALRIAVPASAPDPVDTVVVLDVEGPPDVCEPPLMQTRLAEFVGRTTVEIVSQRPDATVRYSTDRADPTPASPIAPRTLEVSETTDLAVRYFRGDRPLSGTRRMTLRRVEPRPALRVPRVVAGLRYSYYEVDCNVVADLRGADPVGSGVCEGLDITRRRRDEHFGFVFDGLIRLPADGMYVFGLTSDDGAVLRVGGEVVVDHDGLHAATTRTGHAALRAGLHPFELRFFEKGGLEALELWIEGPDGRRVAVDATVLLHEG